LYNNFSFGQLNTNRKSLTKITCMKRKVFSSPNLESAIHFIDLQSTKIYLFFLKRFNIFSDGKITQFKRRLKKRETKESAYFCFHLTGKNTCNFLKSLPVIFSVLNIVFIRFCLILKAKRGHDSKYICKKKIGKQGEGRWIEHNTWSRSFNFFLFSEGGHCLYLGSMKIGGLAPMGFSFSLKKKFRRDFGWFWCKHGVVGFLHSRSKSKHFVHKLKTKGDFECPLNEVTSFSIELSLFFIIYIQFSEQNISKIWVITV